MTDSAIWIQTKTGPDRWYCPAKEDCYGFIPEAGDVNATENIKIGHICIDNY